MIKIWRNIILACTAILIINQYQYSIKQIMNTNNTSHDDMNMPIIMLSSLSSSRRRRKNNSTTTITTTTNNMKNVNNRDEDSSNNNIKRRRRRNNNNNTKHYHNHQYPQIIECNSILLDDCTMIPLGSSSSRKQQHQQEEKEDEEQQEQEQMFIINNIDNNNNNTFFDDYYNYYNDNTNECQYIHEWITGKNHYWYLTCNTIHEIDMLHNGGSSSDRGSSDRGSSSGGSSDSSSNIIQHVASGSTRSVWLIQDNNDNNGQNNPQNNNLLALKTHISPSLQYKIKRYPSSWQDTMILNEMTFSSNILSIYSSCGLSQILEIANGYKLENFILAERKFIKKKKQQQQQEQQISSSNSNSNSRRVSFKTRRSIMHNDDSKSSNNNNHTSSSSSSSSSVDTNSLVSSYSSNSNSLSSNLLYYYINKLKIFIQLIKSILDLHKKNIGHVDLDSCQFVFSTIDGMYKLQDFHISSLLKHNISATSSSKNNNTNDDNDKKNDNIDDNDNDNDNDNDICIEEPNYSSWFWFLRAPEDEYKSNIKKSDVYMLGNILYNVSITSKWIFEDEYMNTTTKTIDDEQEQKNQKQKNQKRKKPNQDEYKIYVEDAIRKGIRSKYPISLLQQIQNENETNSKNNNDDDNDKSSSSSSSSSSVKSNALKLKSKAIKAMINSINMAWTHDVLKRPNAKYIYNYLLNELKEILSSLSSSSNNNDNIVNDNEKNDNDIIRITNPYNIKKFIDNIMNDNDNDDDDYYEDDASWYPRHGY